MAQLYTLEPQTNAKVLLKTNFGDLELELWGQQTPLTTRNFLQLCYDGYYNGTVFHRLVPGFILQGGDPTGTGHGGEAIYPGGLFADEFHPRLKYNRRGLVGMANSGRKDDNGSQFFLTLGDTKELTGKNTMFGKIVGDTIYNLVRMGELECEEGSEKPLYPPKIESTEVLVNPFDDIKPKETKRKAEVLEQPKKKAPARKKGGKALLSFGGDEEGEEVAPVKKKPKFNTRLVVDAPQRPPTIEEERPEAPKPEKAPPSQDPAPRKSTSKRPIRISSRTPSPPREVSAKSASPERSPSRSPTPPPSKSAALLAQTNAQIAALKKSLRRSASPPPSAAPATKKKSLLKLQKEMLPPTSVQGRKRRRKQDDEDEEAFLALQKFREKLASAPPEPTITPTSRAPEEKEAPEQDEDEVNYCDLHFVPNCQSCSNWDAQEKEDDEGADVTTDLWSHALNFEKDRLGKDLTWKKKNEELVVIDPRDKEKEILGKRRGGGGGMKGSRRDNERRREERRL